MPGIIFIGAFFVSMIMTDATIHQPYGGKFDDRQYQEVRK